MNTFFYAVRESSQCQTMINRLKLMPNLKDMVVLASGSRLNTPEALMMRRGDLIFLFASDTRDLDELIAMGNEFTGFRIIIILPDQDNSTDRKSHLLMPRFILSMKDDLNRLETIIDKIAGSNSGRKVASAMAKSMVHNSTLQKQ